MSEPMLQSPVVHAKQRKSVLTSQFVTGLCPELQFKVVVMEGGTVQHMMKVHFEEAKNKELIATNTQTLPKRTNQGTTYCHAYLFWECQ